MELFPYAPWWLERRTMVSDIAWVVDYDDAWFHRYGEHTNPLVRLGLKDKIAAVMRRATSVVVGSRYLQDYASRVNANVLWAPTAIDLSRYPPQQPPRSDTPFTIGWIGSPGTTEFLTLIAGTLSEFCATRKARVVFMGAGDNAPSGSCFSQVSWSAETEVNEMSSWDVGIMPLADSPFARGKCAFKLIQYMGCWKPVVASPVGENKRVVEHGVTGFLADSPSEWMAALTELYEDRARGLRMGAAGRELVERTYSRSVVAPRVADCLKSAVRRHRQPVS
jgi:glycosyltransferase involved in cell wall biosynthesis